MDKYERLKNKIKYQIKDAITYVGVNPKTSGGWVDSIIDPIAEDIYQRIKKVLDTDL